MEKITVNAQKREIFGRAVKSLRTDGFVPSVIYGRSFEPISIMITRSDFDKALKNAGESTLIYVSLEGNEYPTIIHDVAKDSVSGDVLHADFYKVNLKKKITADVPLEFIGEAPAIKNEGGILVKNLSEVSVEALPINLPHSIRVDLSTLEKIGDQILVSDLDIPEGVEVEASPEDILVLVQEAAEEEVEETETNIEDVEIGDKKSGTDELESESGESEPNTKTEKATEQTN